MATALANTPRCLRNSNLFRFSFSFFRSLSSASSSPSSASQNPTTSNKSKRRKKKNLFEVAQFLPNWGIGYHMAKTHWADVSYEITKINLYKDGRHGKAWGIVHKNGLPAADAPKKISGVHKRCWRYIANVVKSSESSPNLTRPTDGGLKVETQEN
ncbi:putative mitochondrial 28S ribosomal protein S34 [Senna tora]|uniref:Putative mitochondrial 28S ribosomal protein S34 n=1 Tax=Senna tora TaxID=362788 RepID=A0A834SKL1_9FABA|nr:putative mitochondrial 28S ribosomal protein S34 [Senna tora]